MMAPFITGLSAAKQIVRAISSGSTSRPKVDPAAILFSTSCESPTCALNISVFVNPGQTHAV